VVFGPRVDYNSEKEINLSLVWRMGGCFTM